MATRFRSEDEPTRTRLDYWHGVLCTALAPVRIRVPDSDIRSQIHQATIGPVSAMRFRTSAIQATRTPDLIGKSDPDMYKINLATSGEGIFEQEGRQSRLKPGEVILMDLARPSHLAIEQSQDISIVMFPRQLLPVRHNRIRELTAVRFPTGDPYTALVAVMARELVKHLDFYDGVNDARIGTAFLDLVALAIATRLDRESTVPTESREHAMKLRVQAFIEQHLGDPDLSPATIAAAHHISTRTLHKLFEPDEHTVTVSIRRRRLEHCRADLLDPSLLDRPVSVIGARWGFRDPAGFSRAFRAAYGVPPTEYRAIKTDATPPPEQDSARPTPEKTRTDRNSPSHC
ncbi:helix-turn-helix domain-containing protein [Nocardia sp. NPDC049149]|uniref:AraC-like ligand-binding domain-containing protein n=1 Tax=Nocardia sp. NPDC049149 TaxID=3364315 RepID=UPI0037187CF4